MLRGKQIAGLYLNDRNSNTCAMKNVMEAQVRGLLRQGFGFGKILRICS